MIVKSQSEIDNIKTSIYKAPAKYDFVMKNKSKICFLYIFASGSIVLIILSIILVCVPSVFSVLTSEGYWMLFPVCGLLLGYLFGILLFSRSISSLYSNKSLNK